MKISHSSAEFEANSDFQKAFFGDDNFRMVKTTGENGVVTHSFPPYGSIKANESLPCQKLSYDDIDKISMWDNYKNEIKSYNRDVSVRKDLFGNNWIQIGFTGGGYSYLVGDYKL